ncbi:hypothetical protein OH76DRAFT_1420046 [Lentinus brumalis]|uniref:Uncharacterized protein n=1 Tax=Lentinus brumalis TaxID=2498619 RepID=A0A371D242_9APHY|nr:hypothetical protein OH76DRAFT_1420046 [Polyporus brumalis]
MELYVDFARALREQYNEDECIFKRLKLEVAKDIDWLPHYVMCVQVNKTYYFAQATDTFKSARGIAAGLALCGENEQKFTEICAKHGVDVHDVLNTLHKYKLPRLELPGKLDPSHTDNAEVWCTHQLRVWQLLMTGASYIE